MLTSVNGLPESLDSCYLCTVKNRKSYLLILLAVLAMAAISAYELYWIKGLYKTRREAAESEIRVSITWAEMEELTSRRKQATDSIRVIARVYSGTNARISKIVSSKYAAPGDSIPESITVTKMDQPLNLDLFEDNTGRINLPAMDSILVHRLDSLGYPLSHRLVLMDGEEVLDETTSPGYAPSSRMTLSR